MTERRFDCFCREGFTAFLYATKVAWASIGDEDDITGLSTGPMILGEGGTIHITDSRNQVELRYSSLSCSCTDPALGCIIGLRK